MKAEGIEPDASSYDSAINSCRAFLRALQTQSSSLPSMPYPKRKRKQRKPPRRNKKKLVWPWREKRNAGRGWAFETLIFQTSWNPWWFQSIPKYQYVSSTFWDIADETTSSHVGKDSK